MATFINHGAHKVLHGVHGEISLVFMLFLCVLCGLIVADLKDKPGGETLNFTTHPCENKTTLYYIPRL